MRRRRVSADGGTTGKWLQAGRLVVADIPIYAVAAVLLAFCLAIFAAYGIGISPLLIVTNARLYAVAGFAMAVADLAWLLWRNRPDKPTAFLAEAWRRRL